MTSNCYDLNLPDHARAYLSRWQEEGALHFEQGDTPASLDDKTVLSLAREVFMRADKRKPPTGTLQ